MRIPAAIVLVLAVVGCSDGLGALTSRPAPAPDGKPALLEPGERSPRIASYRIDAALDIATHRIAATQTLTWKNTGTRELTSLPFHLYMNAFKNDESVFMKESRGSHRGIDASGASWGWIEVSSIQIAGEELAGRATKPGPDETVLEVPLSKPLAPGETVAVTMTFTTQLPEVFARTGFKGPFVMIAQWFPKIGVLVGPPGAERFHCEPFHLYSEFFADFGSYDVTLTVPDTHVVAATGVLVASDAGDGNTHRLTYRAEDVHDFAFMADPYMEVQRGVAHVGSGDRAREVEVRVYHRPAQRDFARRHLAAGIGAIEMFSELFVPYPWPVMSIIDPPPEAGGAAGMEYPTLVTTAGDGWYSRDGVRLPEYVTIHEVGHNWFQGILASNEVDEAWMDEGVNEWADGEVIARLYGERAGIVDWMGISLELHRLRRAVTAPLGSLPSPIATASWAFVDDDAYAAATYVKTAMALKTLENLVGRDAFLGAMKRYAQTWAFRHPTGRDFFAAVSDGLDQDLAWFWGPVFHGVGAVDYLVRSATCRPRREPRGVFGEGGERRTVTDDKRTGSLDCQVIVVNQGTVAVPVDIELRFADGTKRIERWDHRGEGHWHSIRFESSTAITEVVIDPDSRVLLADGVLDDHVRLAPDERASWRAAARLSFWTHTMMQGVGL